MKTKLFISVALACLVAFTFTGCKKSPKMPIVTEIEDNGDGTYTLYDDYRLCKGSESNFKTTSQKKQIETWNICERCGRFWSEHDKK